MSFDVLDFLIIGLVILATIVSIFNFQFSIFNFALGFKYDFLPLLAFLLLRRVPWSAWFSERAMRLILWVGGIVAAYGILTLVLPDRFFAWLGYSDLHSLYVPGRPLAAFQQIGGLSLHRIQSTMSGPNQLGVWLLIPLGIAVLQRKSLWSIVLACLFLVALVLTFSRAAWIAAFVMIVCALWPVMRQRKITVQIVSGCLLLVAIATFLFPSVVLRLASSRGHIERPLQAIAMMVEHPFGLGLGTAGPASNRISDTCVQLEPGDDPSWAKSHPDLCVFVGPTKVQPLDRDCQCPLLTENWYLQIGVEMGWMGFVLYIALVTMTLRALSKLTIDNGQLTMTEFSIFNFQFSIFLALSLAALFLHAWEDAAVAYTVWILMAFALPRPTCFHPNSSDS